MPQLRGVFLTNWTDTGLTVPIGRYEFDIEVRWVDDDGVEHTYGPVTHVFPNALVSMPMSARRRWIERALVYAARVQLGEQDWDNFE